MQLGDVERERRRPSAKGVILLVRSLALARHISLTGDALYVVDVCFVVGHREMTAEQIDVSIFIFETLNRAIQPFTIPSISAQINLSKSRKIVHHIDIDTFVCITIDIQRFQLCDADVTQIA